MLRTVLTIAAICVANCSSSIPAKELAAEDASCLLQTGEVQARARREVGRHGEADGKCLKFMHIPKTGGTSIDSWGMNQHPMVFDSFMRQTYTRIAEAVGPRFESEYRADLGVMYTRSHANKSYYDQYLNEHLGSYRLISQPDNGFCEDLHTPPAHDPAVEAWYKQGDCNVVCAVRNPFKRFLSAYQMNKVGPCDAQGFEAKMRTFLPWVKNHPSMAACMFIPQVEYVYGAKSKALSSHQFCTHIVHTEHLDAQWSATMKDLGKPDTPKLPWLFTAKEMDTHCKVDPAKLTQASKDLIYEHYKADFEALGYPRP